MGPEKLQSLRRVATIESVGSSTRIEGARLSDRDVEFVLREIGSESFQSRDEQEVAGYAYVTETVQAAWQDLRLTEGILLQVHRDLLRYSSKDERHRGAWKTLPNHVAAFDAEGREIGIIFQTTSPFETTSRFDTPQAMAELRAWHLREEDEPSLHPLLRIAVIPSLPARLFFYPTVPVSPGRPARSSRTTSTAPDPVQSMEILPKTYDANLRNRFDIKSVRYN